jgi:hypothetical protein
LYCIWKFHGINWRFDGRKLSLLWRRDRGASKRIFVTIWDIFYNFKPLHLIINVAMHMITLEWRWLYCIWKFDSINCRFKVVIFTVSILRENFTASIGDLMVANWVYCGDAIEEPVNEYLWPLNRQLNVYLSDVILTSPTLWQIIVANFCWKWTSPSHLRLCLWCDIALRNPSTQKINDIIYLS